MNTYAAEQPDKEQEVIPAVTSLAVPDPEEDKMTSLVHVDVQLDSKSRGMEGVTFSSDPFLRWRVENWAKMPEKSPPFYKT